MKISIITPVFNNKDFIEECIKSVESQSYLDMEHIIIDGGSTDGTLEILKKYKDKIKVVSEKDRGSYDAMNKGINLAEGDIIGILNSDDIYFNKKVLKKVADCFIDKNIGACYGDLIFVKKNNLNKLVRYWKAGEYIESKLNYGWMPPHPTFFVRKSIYDKYGVFNLNFKLASDYELILRLLKIHKIKIKYIPEILVKMRTGGRGSKNLLLRMHERMKAWKINKLKLPIFFLTGKAMSRTAQYFSRP